MPRTRPEIEEALRVFASNLPALAEVTDPLAEAAIERLVSAILADAEPEDRGFVRERLTCLLGSAGVIPSDNEDEPCVGSG